MAAKKASPKKATSKKAPRKSQTKKPDTKPKAERNKDGKVKITFLNRADDAICEMREGLADTDPFTELQDIRKGYVEIYGMLKKQANPKYENIKKIEQLRKILDQRHRNLMEELDKLVPSFALESVNLAIKEAKDGAGEFDAESVREEVFARLLKGLKSK